MVIVPIDMGQGQVADIKSGDIRRCQNNVFMHGMASHQKENKMSEVRNASHAEFLTILLSRCIEQNSNIK